ncbi:MAG: PKD domain-containing protein [Candidatus Bathyarchaeia archaeon]
MSRATSAGAGVIVEGADSIWAVGLGFSSGLSDAAKAVSPRIAVEYADFMVKAGLQRPLKIEEVASAVSARIVVEYAECVKGFGLARPLFVSPTVRNITALQREGTGMVDINFQVYDARPFVVVRFQFWNGSEWIDCVTSTGEGQVDVGAVKGTWNARVDFNNRYVKDMKIRVVADNGEPVNNVGLSETQPFVLDTKPPLANAGSDQTVYQGTNVTLNGSHSWDESGIVDYTWTFRENGELKILKGVNPNYIFRKTGVYSITLNVTDPFGNWALDTVTISVIPVEGDSEPPRILNLEREPEAPQPGQEVQVKANVIDEGSGVNAVELYYRVDGGAWKIVAMNYVDGVWKAIIPGQTNGANVEYYVKAFDKSGNTAVSPTYNFTVSSQAQPSPVSISLSITPPNPTTEDEVTFIIDVKSDSYILAVQLEVDGDAIKVWTEGASLVKSKTYTYTGGPYPHGRHSYRAYFIDMSGRTIDTGTKYFDVSNPIQTTWWIWISILTIIGVATTLIVTWIIKKKKKETSPPSSMHQNLGNKT